jgi:hypothetical protein
MSDQDEFDYYDDRYHQDEWDPNQCPQCGHDLLFGMCVMIECMWTPDDDESDGLCTTCGGTGVDQVWARKTGWDGRDDDGLPPCSDCSGQGWKEKGNE